MLILKRVGIDSQYGGHWSVIKKDKFYFVCIPESRKKKSDTKKNLFTYSEYYEKFILEDCYRNKIKYAGKYFVPEKIKIHLDPDLEQFTYGTNTHLGGNGKIQGGNDVALVEMIKNGVKNIGFYAAYQDYDQSQPNHKNGRSGYYLFALFENCQVFTIKEGREKGGAIQNQINENQHVKRQDPDTQYIICANRKKSFRLKKPLLLTSHKTDYRLDIKIKRYLGGYDKQLIKSVPRLFSEEKIKHYKHTIIKEDMLNDFIKMLYERQ